MPQAPPTKRAYAFVDGQNLFNAAKRAFGYDHPNYDVKALAAAVCARKGWTLGQVRFYTGIPIASEDPGRHAFWVAKLAQMGRQGVICYSRRLQYHDVEIDLPGGAKKTLRQAREKGIDVRLAIDVVTLGLTHAYDVALIFSQDQDLSEVAREIRRIGGLKGWWLWVASAFPQDGNAGIHDTEKLSIDRVVYDQCLDPRDYRPIVARAEANQSSQRTFPCFNPPRLSS